MADSPPVDVDAQIAFVNPRRIVLALTFVAGLLDAVGYSQYGVFTANQAGNLVIGWTLLPDNAAAALLSLASIIGCGMGVAGVVVLRRSWPALARGSGSRALLIAAAAGILAAAVIGRLLTSDPAGSADLWTGQWWSQAVAIALSAASVAALAMVFISGAGMRAPILASTNAYVDAVRYGTASVLGSPTSDMRVRAWRAAGFPLAWTLGAAVATFLPFGSLGTVACGVVVVIGVAVISRRVSDPTDGLRRTV